MKTSSLKLTAVLTAIVFGGCSYLPFSGGALKGEERAAMEDWSSVADVSIIQLETNPNEPYSVNLWMIADGADLLVYGGDSHAQWAQNIDADPAVRVKIGDYVYPLQGKRETDEAAFRAFVVMWDNKYGSDRSDSTAADTYLYRPSAAE